jgi:hypothetical protein
MGSVKLKNVSCCEKVGTNFRKVCLKGTKRSWVFWAKIFEVIQCLLSLDFERKELPCAFYSKPAEKSLK